MVNAEVQRIIPARLQLDKCFDIGIFCHGSYPKACHASVNQQDCVLQEIARLADRHGFAFIWTPSLFTTPTGSCAL